MHRDMAHTGTLFEYTWAELGVEYRSDDMSYNIPGVHKESVLCTEKSNCLEVLETCQYMDKVQYSSHPRNLMSMHLMLNILCLVLIMDSTH